jgi:hypothetical protein
MTDEELRIWAVEMAITMSPVDVVNVATRIAAFVRPQTPATTHKNQRTIVRSTTEQKLLIGELYVAGVPNKQIFERVNALPGPRLTGQQMRNIATVVLGLKRPPGHITPNLVKALAARAAKRLADGSGVNT